jgi:putative two-component system response regulator
LFDLSNNPRKPSIMVIDDTPANLDLLAGMLRHKGYKVRPSTSGAQALKAAKNDPPDLILLDITMPGMSGFEVCLLLKADKLLKDIPVIFISALAETTDKVKAFTSGGVDYVTKPFRFEEVLARVKVHLKVRDLQRVVEGHNHMLNDLVRSQTKEILDSRMATIFAITRLAESRDDETGKHLERVQVLCRTIALDLVGQPPYGALMTESFVENLYQASPLHDIGKVAIPDAVLLKPGKLTAEEFALVQTHPRLGADTLKEVLQFYPGNDFLQMGIDITLSHHERWDGTGYPEGLVGTSIPLSARIMAVVDVYDALRSRRAYKATMTHEQSLAILVEESGTHFDPELVRLFTKNQGQIGSLYSSLII